MPTLPKGKRRPWIPEKPKHMREVDNASFYNSKRWRALRNYFIQKFPLCNSCHAIKSGKESAEKRNSVKIYKK